MLATLKKKKKKKKRDSTKPKHETANPQDKAKAKQKMNAQQVFTIHIKDHTDGKTLFEMKTIESIVFSDFQAFGEKVDQLINEMHF